MANEGSANQTPTLLQVLMALKDNVSRDLNVCNVAIVTQVYNDGTAMCQEFTESISFQAYYLKGMEQELQQGDIVVVLYADKDFRSNLKNFKKGSSVFSQNSEFETLHTKANGIIVGILYRR